MYNHMAVCIIEMPELLRAVIFSRSDVLNWLRRPWYLGGQVDWRSLIFVLYCSIQKYKSIYI